MPPPRIGRPKPAKPLAQSSGEPPPALDRRAERVRPRTRRRRARATGGESTRFKKGSNSQDGTVHRRGADLIPRRSMQSLFETVAYADAGTIRSLERDRTPSYRVLLARSYIKAAKAKNPRLGMLAAADLADRLEGKPVQSVRVQERRTTIFQGPGGEPLTPAPNPVAEGGAPSLVPVVLPPEGEQKG